MLSAYTLRQPLNQLLSFLFMLPFRLLSRSLSFSTNRSIKLEKRKKKEKMGSGGESTSFSSIPDWDWEHIDPQEIEAAFSLAESLSAKRPRTFFNGPLPDSKSNSRRLPVWASPPAHSRDRDREIITPKDYDSALSTSSFVPSPCRFNRKVKYPKMNFGGQVVYCRTSVEVEKATMELLEMVEEKKQNMDQISLGLDIEWRPTFIRGESPGKAAVMQICASADHCYVMHIFHSGIPPILQSLLEDSTSTKVGVCIAGDAKKIENEYNVCIRALEDLSGLANIKLGGAPKMWGLSSLVEELTCKQLEKRNKIRLGNWEANWLSKEQLDYAATDAYASWYLYQVLRSFPDAPKEKELP